MMSRHLPTVYAVIPVPTFARHSQDGIHDDTSLRKRGSKLIGWCKLNPVLNSPGFSA